MDHQSAMLAARTLTAARRSGTRIDGLPDGAVPQTLADGYQIQDVVVACHGEQVGAWKIGATHPNAQAGLGVDGAVASRLFTQNIMKGNQELPDTYLIRGLEAEYAFLLGADLPPTGAPYSASQIAAAITSVHPAIEVVDTRFTSAQQGPIAVCDNVNDGVWIYGEGATDWQNLDIINAPVTMQVNDEVINGSGEQVLGDPMISLTWLVNEHASAREGLRAGQFITTGSCTGLYKAPAGCHAKATFGGLGELTVQFVV